MTASVEDLIKSAASVARDAAEGRLDPAALDAAVSDECRSLFGVVVGRDDPLWALHVDVARQVLGLGGVTADELSEWLAVARRREVGKAEGTDVPTEPISSASGPHSPDSGDDEPHSQLAMDP
jgi:hypothetical protein